MKKKFLVMAVAAVVAVGAAWNVSQANGNEALSDVALENIEALAASEPPSTQCNNTNGYRSWSTETNNPLGNKREFYDCCYVLRQGYAPEGSCQ